MNKLRERTTRMVAPLPRTFAMLLVASATCSAWAATGDKVTLTNGSGGSYATSSFTSSDTYTIKIPETDGLVEGDYVRIDLFAYGMGSVNHAFNAKNIKVTDYDGNVISLGSACGINGWTDVKFGNNSWKQFFGVGDACILKVGETYAFYMLNSSGNATAQQVWAATDASHTTLATSPVVQSTTDTGYRMTQEVVLTKLSGKPLTASISASDSPINLTALSWSESLPGDLTQCPSLIITVTGNATLNIDSAITADQVVFRIEQGATLKLTGSQIATVCGVVIGGKGAVDLTEANIAGLIYKDDIIIVDSATDEAKSFMQSTLSYHITARGSESSGVSVSFDNNQRFYTHVTFDGGTHNLTSINGGQNYTLCDNSSNSDPMWLVKNGTALNVTAKDFAGYQGSSKAEKCVVAAEDGATITLKDNGSNTFYASNRWLLYPGSLLNISTSSDRFKVIGGSTSGQEQFYVPAGSGEAVIGGSGTINLHAAVGIFVGEGSTLKIANEIKQSNNIVKRGSGAWKQTGSMSTYTGSITIEAGTLALVNGLDLNASTSLKFSAGTTLAIEETAKGVVGDGTVTLKVTSDSEVPNIVVYEAGTTTPIPGATISKDDTTLTITYTPVSVSDSFCWMDFEFNNTTDSSGQLTGSLKSWGKDGYVSYYYNNSQLYMDCKSASDNMTAFTFPSEWTAVMRTTLPAHANDKPMAMLMCGNPSHSTYSDAIGIVATKDGRVALATGTDIIGVPVSVDDATTKMHYYVIRKASDKVELFVDGELEVSSDTSIAPAGVFQIGDVYNGSSVYSDCNVAARVDYLRFYNCALGDNMLAAIRASAPWMSVTLDNEEGSDWSALSWSEDFNPDSNVQITVASASSIEIGSATTIGILKLVGSADLTIADIGNLTVSEFDLSDYTGNLTLSVDSAATATTWKFTGSADVTIAGISDLTLGAFDLSGYTGDLIVDGGLPAPITLNGGNLKFNIASGGSGMSTATSADAYQGCAITGTGNVYKLGTGVLFLGRVESSDSSQLSNTYSGSTYIASGIVRRWYNAFGADNNVVYVQSGGAVDLLDTGYGSCTYTYHLAGTGSAGYPGMFMSQGVSGNGGHSVKEIILDADANIGGDTGIRIGTYSWGYNEINLNGHKLTKTGTGTFAGDAYKFIGEGTFEVQRGKYSAMGQHFSGSNAKLIVNENASVSMYPWGNGANQAWKDVVNNNRIYYEGNRGENTFVVSGTYSGNGSIDYLTIANGVTIKPTCATTGMVVSDALTFQGTINVDLSEVDLTGMSDLAIITGSAQIDLEDDVDDFDLGSNSSNWELYSEEVSTGVYALGVRLKTIESSVAWNGAGGTWSANSFNGGTENYSNQALQTVTFADDGESATTPLAVTVSGAKTVNALNFTADNRNVTLSGDAITAATVSKSGDGVAIINNDLSGETSISVTDGVLVLNPTSAVVSDEWTESDNGTLVVYVDSGDTTTISATITATKLIKRGAGTLVLGNTANSISGGILVSEGTLKGTGNGSATVTCFGSGAVTVEDGAAIDINNARFTNQVYIIGNGPDGNGAYINTGDDSNGAHSGGMQSSIANKLTLTGNASIGGTATIHFGGSSAIDIGTYTLTKKGTFWFPLAGTTISGSGKIIIAEGDFSNNSGANNLGGIDLEITGGTLDMAAGTSMSVKGFKSATAITANATASSSATLIVNGKIEVNGTLTIPKLQLNAGSSIEYAATGGLTVSVSLTLPSSGYVNVDVRDLALSDSGTTIMTLGTAPESIDKLSCDHAVLELSGTTIKAYPAVASVTLSDGSSTSYSTLGGAKAQATANSASYKYITILSDMSFSPESYKYKIADGVSVTPLALSDEYLTPTADDPDPETGAFTYNAVSPAATTYTWAGTQTLKLWSQPGNWTHGESVVAMRSPTTCDSVIINSDTTASAITVGDVTVRDMSIGNTVKMTAASAKTLTVTDGVELTSDSATLEIAGSLTLSADVTTSVPGKCVTFVDNGSSIIYSVVDPEAEIDGGDVYDSLANAIAAAEAGDTVNLLANASVGSVGKAITLDVGTHGLTITSANALDSITSLKGTGTLVLPSASLPTSALQTLLKNSSNWKGTLALSGLTANTATQNFKFSNYGNANSKIQLTNCAISYLDNVSSYFEGCLVLCDDADHHAAFATGNGYSDKYNKIGELAGDGAISATGGPLQMYCFLSAPDYTGSITVVGSWDNGNKKYDGRRIVFGEPPLSLDNSSDPGSIRIKSDVQVGLGEGAAWNASYGIYISGTIIVNGGASLTSNLALGHENDSPKNLRDDKYIVFYDGAKLLYKKLCTITTTGDVTLAAGSTVAIAFADGVSLVDGTKLIGWSAAPAGTFAFDNGSGGTVQYKTEGGVTYVLSSESDGLYLRKAVAFTYDGVPPVICYYSSVAAALSEGTNIYLNDAPNETVALVAGKTININGKDVSNLTVNAPTVEYVSPMTAVDNSYSLANATSAPVTYYWVGSSDSAWGTIGNWKVGASDGPVATRAIESTDSVAFANGALVALGATRTVAGIAVNGEVTITAKSASAKELKTSGNITGTGTLTFVDVCLSSMASGLTIDPNVNFTDDSELGGDYPFTFSGNVNISDRFPQWGSRSVINGSVSVASGANIYTAGSSGALTINGTTTFNGAFTKSGSHVLTLGAVSIASTTTPTISGGGSISLTGAVTIQTGATFTLPDSGVTVGEGASFVLAANDAKLVDNGSGASGKVSTSVADSIVVTTSGVGTTTYSVAGKATETIGEGEGSEDISVITPAEGVTSIGISGVSGKVAIPVTVTQISGVEAANLLLKVTYNSGANTAYYAILSLDGSGNVSLNGSATVNGVKVQPEPVDTAPIGVSSTTTKPTFGVKAIPGLWYALKSSSSPTGPFTTLEATKQATGSSVTLDASDAVTSVKYYKISAGATETDL